MGTRTAVQSAMAACQSDPDPELHSLFARVQALEQADRADQVQIDSMLSSLAHLREAEAEAGAGVANDAATATVTTPTGPPETGLSDANLAGKAAHAASVAVEDPTPTPAPTDGSVDAASQELHQSRQNTIDDDTFSRLLQDVSSTRTSEERLALINQAFRASVMSCERFAMLLSSLRLPAEKIQAAQAAVGRLVDPERCKSVLVPTLTNEIGSICVDIISILS